MTGLVRKPAPRAALVEALSDSSPTVRQAVAEALLEGKAGE
jgi:HEAT repeat protein